MSALPSLQVRGALGVYTHILDAAWTPAAWMELSVGYSCPTWTPAAWTLPPIPRRRLLIQPTQSRSIPL